MWAFLLVFLVFFRNVRDSLRDPEFRAIAGMTLVALLGGTWFYRTVEGWRWIDAFYFSVVTLATVGYGDFTPQTDAGKLFTVFYILLGLGIITTFVSKLLAQHRQRRNRSEPSLERDGDERPA